MAIQVKTLDQIKTMRRAGLVVAEIHKAIREAIKPGMTTSALDTIAEAVIKRNGATSNFKGYHGFPATICVSINDEIVHGIPGDRVINDGDVVSVDCGAIVEGWHGDAAFSIGIGAVNPEDQKLMDVCEEEYGGHGIGTEMHQEPHVLNFGKAGNGPEIIPGFVLAIEPMITRGSARTKVLSDDWTVVSVDQSRGSHFEHTYAILPDGKPLVLTAFDGGKEELARLGIEVSDLL